MALRREDLNPEELARQRALDRSWEQAHRDLTDPVFRDLLEQSLRQLDTKGPRPMLTRDEFLARTEPPSE